ncbi:MAG: lytic transglycosylase [Caulobacteraceae bacterium]|nr:lytic transglycosylase [Caulobacteraceae bacterium]
MVVQSIRGVVQTAIESAAKATGVDFGFLLGTAKRESGYNPAAKAQTSSASGLFQVLDQTWMAMLKKHGAQHGYANYANLISQGSDGRFFVANPDARKAVMDLKLEPQASSLMAAELANDNAAYLRGRLGRAPSAGELYAAHFLGPQGAASLIETTGKSPGANAASLFPDAASANRSIFYAGGRARSVSEVYAELTRDASGGAPQTRAPVVTASADSDFISYASGQKMDQMQQQAMLVDLLLRGSQDADPVSAFLGPTDRSSSPRAGDLATGMLSGEMMRLLSLGVGDKK